MKNFKSLVESLPNKTIVFAFGRFQPPTIGHALLVSAVKQVAQKNKADHVIYASRTQDKKSNPLPVDRKIYYLKRMFKGVNFAPADDQIKTFMHAAKILSQKYSHLIMIAGSDRVEEYKTLLEKYNGKDYTFKSIQVISAGERDPDADSAVGMSGTKMRDAAKAGNFSAFRKGLPKTLTDLDAKRLMNEVREGLGLEIVKEELKLVNSDIREKYFKGEIFHVGEIVESNENVYKIAKRGSNHLLLQAESGELVSKWITDVVYTDKQFGAEMNEELTTKTIKSSDKIKVARIFASTFGVGDVEKQSSPEMLINLALRKIKNKPMRPEYMSVLTNMLATAKEVGIKYDESLVPSKLKEAAKVKMKDNESDVEFDYDDEKEEKECECNTKTKTGHSLGARDDHHRKMKVKYQLGEEMEDDLSDDELDKLINSLSEDDYLDAYDDDELAIIDEESGELVEEIKEETEQLTEVLSRMERIKSKIRFARTSAKRNRRLKIALKMRSNVKTLNKRAKRLAIKAVKERLMKKPVGKMSVAEKERAEKMIAARKGLINRLAMRMVPKVRKIESERLSHSGYTKDK